MRGLPNGHLLGAACCAYPSRTGLAIIASHIDMITGAVNPSCVIAPEGALVLWDLYLVQRIFSFKYDWSHLHSEN